MGDSFEASPRLEAWVDQHWPEERMLWHGAAHQQLQFLHLHAPLAIAPCSAEERERIRHEARVAGTHTSKSIVMPVYAVWLPGPRVQLVMRGNFHDWKVSVRAGRDVPGPFDGLFDPYAECPAWNCEGFPAGWVFGSYRSNPREFTVALANEFELYAFLRELRCGPEGAV
jgi:hypothetical protein